MQRVQNERQTGKEKQRAFFAGARDLIPLIPGILPFGLITGANGISLGFSPDMIIGMTVLFFAGSAQLVAYQMIQDHALPVVVLFTTLMVNMRFAIYSATFAPTLYVLKKRYKWPLAYLLSDQAYGLCASRFPADDHSQRKILYYTGAALTMWLSWLASVVTGMIIGDKTPPEWSLEFSIPLAFLAMLVSTIHDRTTLATAVIAAILSVSFDQIPYKAGFIIAIIGGVITGLSLSLIFIENDCHSHQTKEINDE